MKKVILVSCLILCFTLFSNTAKVREENTINKNTQINVSDLHPGIYLLEVTNNNGQRQLSKLMITK